MLKKHHHIPIHVGSTTTELLHRALSHLHPTQDLMAPGEDKSGQGADGANADGETVKDNVKNGDGNGATTEAGGTSGTSGTGGTTTEAVSEDTSGTSEATGGTTSRAGRSGSSGKPPEYIQLKLFSAVFKEAALDSPSFRAMINYIDTQLINTEKWILAVAGMLKKIPPQVKNLESNLNEFLEHLVPLVLQDAFGFLDDEYIYAELRTTKTVLRKFWTLAIDMVQVLVPEAEKLKQSISARVAEYQHHRTRFAKTQETYDRFLTAFMATPKAKEAALVREDLAVLHTVRLDYIHAALELLQHMIYLGDHINAEVSHFNLMVWQLKIAKIAQNPVAMDLFHDTWTGIKRIAAYHDHAHRSAAMWKRELDAARHDMEDATAAQHAPSARTGDYVLLAINFRALHDPHESAINKHGYVFMKTWPERGSKPAWVKRWAFVHGGVFGMLVASGAGTAVHETDKIGVLLCNTRYTPAEDRRFCFELKTIDTSVVLQVETLAQLRLWLTVFDNARARIANRADPAHELMRVASGRYPPLVEEFLAPHATVMDRDLTSAYVVTLARDMVTASSLAAHLDRNDRLFHRYVYPQLPHIALPIYTEASTQALLAYSLTGETAVPTALTANVWGSLNWGVHHLNDLTGTRPREPIPPADATRTLGDGITLPQNYPSRWIAKDVQMRAVFEAALEPDECCLVLFAGLILPNAEHELRGTVVVTQHHLYTYVNTLGFVSLTKLPVERFAEAECVARENFDVVKLVHMNGVVRVKTFLARGELVAAQLNCVFGNQALDAPMGVTRLIHQLVEIENRAKPKPTKAKTRGATPGVIHPAEEETEKSVTGSDSYEHAAAVGSRLGSGARSPTASLPALSSSASDDAHPTHEPNGLNVLSDLMAGLSARLISSYDFDLPPQALLHVLFGSRSSVLDDANGLVTMVAAPSVPWSESNGQLHRLFVTDFVYFTGVTGRAVTTHTIERRVPNRHYRVRVTRGPFKINYGPGFSFDSRLVITALDGGRARLQLFLAVRYDSTWCLCGPFDSLCRTSTTAYFRSLTRLVDAAARRFGNGGKIAKAIYRYGKIPVTAEPVEVAPLPPSRISFAVITRLLFRLVMVWLLLWVLFGAMTTGRAVRAVTRPISAHRVLLAVIFVLALFNTYLGARNSAHWWNSRAASALVREALYYEPMAVEKAIYLKDMHTLVARAAVLGPESVCVRQFRNQSFVVNYNQPTAWDGLYGDHQRAEAVRLKLSLHDIGLKRNQLLVSLRMLNDLEEEVALGEWHNWLMSELAKCDAVLGAAEIEEDNAVEELRGYCQTCSTELMALRERIE